MLEWSLEGLSADLLQCWYSIVTETRPFYIVLLGSLYWVSNTLTNISPSYMLTEPGCHIIRQIANGRVFQSQENGIVAVHCNVGYERKGSHVMFCNGTKWNDTIPVCNGTFLFFLVPQAFTYLVFAKCNLAEKMKEIPRPISTKSKMIDLSLQNDATNNGINCTFDIGGTCGWIQETSSVYRWTVQNASPNSTSTIGPLHDVTSGSSVQTGPEIIQF